MVIGNSTIYTLSWETHFGKKSCVALLNFSFAIIIFSFPCDIVGDISYEELRTAAYDDAKRGLSVQAIVRTFAWC